MITALLAIVSTSIFMLFSQLSPGPDVCLVFRSALSQGWRAGAAVGVGVSTGLFIQAGIVCWAGTWVMQQSWSNYVLLAAVAWFLYLAWKILSSSVFPKKQEGMKLEDSTQAGKDKLHHHALRGFFCNILNPKCMIFIAALSVEGLQRFSTDQPWYAPTLCLALAISGAFGWLLWSCCLQWSPIRSFYMRNLRGVDAFFASALILFALMMGFWSVSELMMEAPLS